MTGDSLGGCSEVAVTWRVGIQSLTVAASDIIRHRMLAYINKVEFTRVGEGGPRGCEVHSSKRSRAVRWECRGFLKMASTG